MKAVRLTFSMLGKRCVVVLPEPLEGDLPANDGHSVHPPLASGIYRVARGDDEGEAPSQRGGGER